MRRERGGIERHADHLFLRAKFDQRLAKEIQHGAVAGIMQVVAIGADAVHADAVTQILNGTGAQQRLPGALYAADLAVRLWTILVKGKDIHPYNVGSDEAISIHALARMIAIPDGLAVTVARQHNPQSAVVRYVPSIARVVEELAIADRITLSNAIARTVQWQTAGELAHDK